MTLADEIREYVNEHYFEPAIRDGKTRLEIVSGIIHKKMGLEGRFPSVCQVLRGSLLQEQYDVILEKEILQPGVKKNSSTNRFVFILSGEKKSRSHSTPIKESAPVIQHNLLDFDILSRFGFKKIGHFILDNDDLDYSLMETDNDNGCYIFSIVQTVMYVGETGNGIKTRLRQYRRGNSSQKTSKRIHELIDNIVNYEPVDIWFVKDEEIANYKVKIDDIEAICDRKLLERFVINGFNPKWNRQ